MSPVLGSKKSQTPALICQCLIILEMARNVHLMLPEMISVLGPVLVSTLD